MDPKTDINPMKIVLIFTVQKIAHTAYKMKAPITIISFATVALAAYTATTLYYEAIIGGVTLMYVSQFLSKVRNASQFSVDKI